MTKIRRITSIVLALLSISMFVLTVHAEDVEIKAVIPATHAISGTVTNGDIIINGNFYTGKFSADITHGSATILRFRPIAGYEVDIAVMDGQDITGLLQNGSYNTGAILWDTTIDVSFKKLSPPSSNATAYTIVGTLHISEVPASNITLELRGMDTKKSLTDSNGKFRFDDVLEGSYTLTLLSNGVIIGYRTFTITKGGTGVHISNLSDGSILVTVEEGVTMIELNMNLNEQGVLEFTDAKAINEKKELNKYPTPVTNEVITVDNSNIRYPIVAMGISLSGLLFMVIVKRRRKA